MTANARKELIASYGKLSREELIAKLAQAQSFIANPGEAKPEAIEGAKLSVEYFNERIAELDAPQEPEKPAKKETFEEKHAELIRQKMNAGLTRDGAIEVIKHQIENDARLAKAKAPKK